MPNKKQKPNHKEILKYLKFIKSNLKKPFQMKIPQPKKPQNDLEILIKRYELLIKNKKEILKTNQNGIVESLVAAYEKIVQDLKNVLKK